MLEMKLKSSEQDMEKNHYETLLTKEEHVVAEDMGGFYRVPADNRDLNYDKYFSEGDEELI